MLDQVSERRLPEEPVEQPAMDHVRILWSRKWLLLLGLLAGLGGGFLYFTRQPPVFHSRAQLQIVEPQIKTLTDNDLNFGIQSRVLSEESLVIRSEKVLTRAAELGSLNETETFRGMSPELIARRLSNSRALEVVPATDDASTVLDVEFTGTDPDDCQRVVQSIVDAYSEHLRSQHQDFGRETLELIAAARGDVLKRLKELEDEYDEFKRTSPLVHSGDTATNIHRENSSKLLAQKQDLSVQLTHLESKYEAVKEAYKYAIENDEPLEAVLLMLADSADNLFSETLDQQALNKEAAGVTNEVEKRSEQLRQSQLIPLEIEEQQYLDTLGPGHPAVKTIQRKIEMTKQLISRVEAMERAYERQVKQQLADAKRNSEENKVEGISIRDRVQFHVRALQQQIKMLKQEMASIDEAYDYELAEAKDISAQEITNQRFARDIARQQELFDRIVQRLDEVEIMDEAEGRKVITLSPPARGDQVGPSMPKALGLGAFLGLACFTGLAYLLEWADRSYRHAQDISEHLQLPVIGHVPQISREVLKQRSPDSELAPVLCTYHKSKGTNAEAYRAVRTSLYFSNQGEKRSVIQVTSSVPGEGKSTMAANLAITIAQSGKSVLLIDCDFRRPTLHKLFGTKSNKGIVWMLEQLKNRDATAEPSDLLGEVVVESEVPNLALIPRGERPNNPSELLSSKEFESMVAAVRDRFDMVLIDTPPMLAVTDPSNVAPRVDGVLFVIHLKKNIRNVTERAVQMLRSLDSEIIGVVVNGIGDRDSASYGKYGGGYGRYGYRNNYGGYKYGYNYGYGYGYGYGAYDYKYNKYYEEEAVKQGRERIEA